MSNLKNIQKNKDHKQFKNKRIVIFISIFVALIIVISIVFVVLNRKTAVYIDFTVDGKVIYSGEVTLDISDPTVIDAVRCFASERKINVVYDNEELPTTILDFDDYPEFKNVNKGLWYFWEFAINDITVYDIVGRAGNYGISDGDHIHWYYSSIPFGEGIYDEEYLY